ncbi:MAG: HD domain-containing protein [Chloroflexi bacterium]|nr:HD domain-containing protein [Chloroflexota bacterium]
MTHSADYLHEVGMLNRTPRTGFQFLGSARQSVAEHSHRMLHVAFLLARMSAELVDELKLLHLVMFHDLPEARTGDQNYVARRYVHEDLEGVLRDGEQAWPYGDQIVARVREFEARETLEARLARDADQLELLLVLKEEADLGNPRADNWIGPLLARLQTDAGRTLAEEILSTPSDHWWFHDRDDPHWVAGHKRPAQQ